MCSDGLSNMVPDKTIEAIILNPETDAFRKRTGADPNGKQNGGKDNIAVILIEPFTKEVEKC